MPPHDTTPRDPASAQLRLRTLGDAALDLLSADGTAIEHQEMSKSLALVTYLACAPTRKESREHLVDLLWSDLEADAAQHALRQHLWLLRKRFGDILTADRKHVSCSGAPLDFDRDALLAAAEQGRCAAVVELYRGEFFLGFAAPGSNEFERWTELERARLRSVFVRCAGQLVREWLSAGRFRDGQGLARRVRDAEPYAQHGWRLLIESHISGGDFLGASVEADAFEQMLASEEMEPEPASRALIVIAQRGPSAMSEVIQAPFSDLVGRETEFGWLMKAWNTAAIGRSTAVHIVAPAGFGKTRLLQDFRARLASLRARVVFIRSDAGSGSIPLSFLSDLVTKLGAVPGAGGVTPEVASVLVGLAPTLASTYPAARTKVGHADEPHVRRSAIRDLMTAIAEERPLAILIDDLHWSDPQSTALLAGVIGSLSKQRLLVVVAQRSATSISNFHADAQQFALAPLSDSAIAALLANVASLPSADWSDGLAGELRRVTGGAPLLVIETLQLAIQREVLSVTNGEWNCRDAGALEELLRTGGAVRQRVERLGQREAFVVRLLSLAQLPLPFDVLCAASRQPVADLGAILASLERLGLVRHAMNQWAIGHDEYAAAALALVTPAEARAMHSALGHSLRDSTEVTQRQRQLATRHLRLANEWKTLHTSFERIACDSRRKGDRQSMSGLAAEFLGTDAGDDDARRLVAGLPLDVRAGLVTPQRKVAAACAVAAPIAALWLALVPAPSRRLIPDYVALVVASDSSGATIVEDLPLSKETLTADSTISLRGIGRTRVHLPQAFSGPFPSPLNEDEWLTARPVSDSGTTDLFISNARSGAEQRLTFAPGDDADARWSPDGRQIVFSTARWSALGHTSLAVLDRTSGIVRRLTSDDGIDTGASWSPDGSHIAFTRNTFDARSAICVVLVNGESRKCFESPERSAPIGWTSDSTIMVVSRAANDHELTEVSIVTGVRRAAGHVVGYPTLSPDGRWLACDCRELGTARPRMLLIRSDSLGVKRHVDIADTKIVRPRIDWRPGSAPPYLDAIRLVRMNGEPIVGVPHHVSVSGFDATNAVRRVPFVQFSASDSTIAAISENGDLVGRRPGTVTIVATAGGWRRDTMTVTVRRNQRDTLTIEDWRSGLSAAWVTFGLPRPQIVTDANGERAFTTAGDGQFHSGVLSTKTHPSFSGLTVDTWISTPITAGQWQELEIDLHGGIDTAKVGAWDSSAGYLWNDGRISQTVNTLCGFKYPAAAEGKHYADSLTTSGALGSVSSLAPPSLRNGHRARLTLQLFPDGRCGVAIDGVAQGVTTETVENLKAARIVILGNSYKTRVLVGPLTISRGVDPSIVWAKQSQYRE